MHEIALFVEDYAHRLVVGPLVNRIVDKHRVEARLTWRNAVGGHGKVVQELGAYFSDLNRQRGSWPSLIIAATDANCTGLKNRVKDVNRHVQSARAPVVLAVPDPHVERWLLLDGAAFKTAVGHGCDAPDQKCNRNRYKERLIDAVRSAGVTPNLGGLEYAEDIILNMDIERAAQADKSLGRFVGKLRAEIRKWQS